MPRLGFLSATLMLAAACNCFGQATDFESLQDGVALTNQITGLTFANAGVLKSGISLNELECPPHSGTNLVYDNGGPITLTLSTPTSTVSGFITYRTAVTLRAFDAANNLVGTTNSRFSSNMALSGATGSSPNELIQVASAGAGIAKITITGDPAGSSFSLDDLTAGTATCTFSINPPSANVGNGSGTTGSSLTGSFTLTASNCTSANTWTATSDSARLQVTSATSGNGGTASATISYSMFTNSTTQPRVAHITVAGQTFTANQSGSTETAGQRVVRALYQTILGREPDSGGFAFWTGTGAPSSNGAVLYNQMADGFYVSPEFSGTGFETLSIYQAANGTLPNFNTWLGTVRQIRNQSLTTSQLVTNLMGTLSNSAFVQQVVQNSYGRPATAAELSQYTGILASSTAANPKLDLLDNTIFQNSFFRNQTNAQFVTMLYYTILVRDVDSGGLAFWLGQVNPPNGQPGIYYLYNPQPVVPAYPFKLAVIGQAVPPNPNLLGFLGSPEFQGLIQ